ncbi:MULTISPECIES: hypothetical protein [unclassified Jeotgalibaca]|uniref:hypothetical protein n=1 Tax=unclassified Jeotgalibaca TaxID=2621505 RepID=UPI003FD3760A
MDLEELLKQFETFKSENSESKLDIVVEQIKDLDDVFGDMYIMAYDEEDNVVNDTLLMTIEEPTKEDMQHLRGIADALRAKL